MYFAARYVRARCEWIFCSDRCHNRECQPTYIDLFHLHIASSRSPFEYATHDVIDDYSPGRTISKTKSHLILLNHSVRACAKLYLVKGTARSLPMSSHTIPCSALTEAVSCVSVRVYIPLLISMQSVLNPICAFKSN
jgi:hypothetical protein